MDDTLVCNYEGGFKNGEWHGHGKLSYCDGTEYTGDFYEGNYHGHGILIKAGGRVRYEGSFVHGKIHGEGVQKDSIKETTYVG